MLESWFSLIPPGNRGAHPESRGDFWGTILGYDSWISYPTRKQGLKTREQSGTGILGWYLLRFLFVPRGFVVTLHFCGFLTVYKIKTYFGQ